MTTKCCWAQAERNGDIFTCPVCGKKIDVGERYIVKSHKRIGGQRRANLHASFENGANCWLNPSDFQVGNCGRVYIEFTNGEVHTITTSGVQQLDFDGKTLTVNTHNTVYVFEKAEK